MDYLTIYFYLESLIINNDFIQHYIFTTIWNSQHSVYFNKFFSQKQKIDNYINVQEIGK